MFRALPLLVVALLSLTSCESYYRYYWEQPAQHDLTFDNIFDACLGTARTEFRIDPAKIDRGLGTIRTRWKNKLAAWGKGRRSRAYFEVVQAEAGDHPKAPKLQVRYYVERQRHVDMATPLDPKEEDWKSDGQDRRVEALLARHLQLRLAQAAGERPRRVRGVKIEDPSRLKQ